jgi:glycosyltransferase involved in cell wall biosynthesis
VRGEADFAGMTDLPTIAIVTPSYQQGRFLEWTLRSVILQRYRKLQYVVMDGGSTDETASILRRYEQHFAHVESGKDWGQADAVARGFLKTSGEIMGYLNSDDLLAPGALEFAADFFGKHPRVDMIYSHRVFLDTANRVEAYWLLPRHHDWLIRRWDYIPQETCFWRRRIYEACGGIDPSFRFALDYDLFVRFMEQGRLVRVNRFLGAFRRHAGSKTSGLSEGRVHPEVERVRREHGIRMPRGHGWGEWAVARWIERRSRRFAQSGRVLAGALAGVGYDYDEVWGGRLSASGSGDSSIIS